MAGGGAGDGEPRRDARAPAWRNLSDGFAQPKVKLG